MQENKKNKNVIRCLLINISRFLYKHICKCYKENSEWKWRKYECMFVSSTNSAKETEWTTDKLYD